MNITDKLKLVDYLTCPTCNGVGTVLGRECKECNGRGVGAWINDILIFWNKPVTRSLIFFDSFTRVLRSIIDGVLLFLGFTGLVALAWQIKLFLDSGALINQLPSIVLANELGYIIWFKITVLIDLYLIYRAIKERRPLNVIVGSIKKHKSDLVKNNITSWSQVGSLSNKRKVDVFDLLNLEMKRILRKSFLIAKKYKQKEFNSIHLLAALLNSDQIISIIARLEINTEDLKEDIMGVLGKNESLSPVLIYEARKALIDATVRAISVGKDSVDESDVLLALNENSKIISGLFYRLGADLNSIQGVVRWVEFQKHLGERYKKFVQVAKLKPGGDINRSMTATATPFMNSVGTDLTQMAKDGYFSGCIGREKELSEIFRIISSGEVYNVVLVGELGSGKSKMIEGIAQRMVEEDVPARLKDKRLVSLNIANLIKEAGVDSVQTKLLELVDEINVAGNVILVIEDIKNLSNISAGEGGMNLSSVLSQIILTNPFIFIATATPTDYTSYIENDETLRGMLQPVKVEELSDKEVLEILEMRTGIIEQSNRVYFSYPALVKAIELSNRLMHDRLQPEKSISVLEEVAVLVAKSRGKNSLVIAADVSKIISEESGVPLDVVGIGESKKLLNLEAKIHDRLIGQNGAVKMVSASLRRARTEMRDVQRPISSFLFLGPTGVGKTELAKSIAEIYFGAEDNMIRLDMSEYQGRSSVERLIGSTGQPGSLTEAVRKKPFALILLDELEKADPEVLNLFLQVMEDGRLNDSMGRQIDFTNCIIIATSNAGSQYIQSEVRAGTRIAQIKEELINNRLKINFKPEFLNRFDGIIVFKPLEPEEINQIAWLMLSKVVDMMEEKGVQLEITDEAVAELVKLGYDPALGARPLRRVIEERVQNKLANLILENRVNRGNKVIFGAGGRVDIV